MAIHPGGFFGGNVLFKMLASDLWKAIMHALEAQVNAKSEKICSHLIRSLYKDVLDGLTTLPKKQIDRKTS